MDIHQTVASHEIRGCKCLHWHLNKASDLSIVRGCILVVLGCLITFFREEEPENSGSSGHRVPSLLDVLSCINVEAAVLVFRNCMSLWNITAVKCRICSRRETAVIHVKLVTFILEFKINFEEICYGLAVASLPSSAEVNRP